MTCNLLSRSSKFEIVNKSQPSFFSQLASASFIFDEYLCSSFSIEDCCEAFWVPKRVQQAENVLIVPTRKLSVFLKVRTSMK